MCFHTICVEFRHMLNFLEAQFEQSGAARWEVWGCGGLPTRPQHLSVLLSRDRALASNCREQEGECGEYCGLLTAALMLIWCTEWRSRMKKTGFLSGATIYERGLKYISQALLHLFGLTLFPYQTCNRSNKSIFQFIILKKYLLYLSSTATRHYSIFVEWYLV